MENFSSGHHKIEEKLPIFPQKPSKRWKKSRWTPSESIYTFFQEIEKFQTARSSDAASSIHWKVAAAPRSVTPRSRCSLRSFDIDDHTRGWSRPLYVSQKYWYRRFSLAFSTPHHFRKHTIDTLVMGTGAGYTQMPVPLIDVVGIDYNVTPCLSLCDV